MNDRIASLRILVLGAAAMVLLVAVAAGCSTSTTTQVLSVPSVATPRIPGSVATLTVTSTSFTNGGAIPSIEAFGGCGGTGGPHGESTDLTWTAGPPATQSYVVTEFDPDAPTGSGFWHWVAFNIPASVTSLTLNASAAGMPAGSVQGTNDYGFVGYGGPCPPPGDPPHHYTFTVSALNVATVPNATSASSGAFVTFNMDSAVIAQGKLLGLYAQP